MVSYCILCGWIKQYNSSITTIMCQRGSYRTVVGMLEYLQNSSTIDTFLPKKGICLFVKCAKLQGMSFVNTYPFKSFN